MPTYQYACTEPDCGHRFELVQSFTDPAASQCPVCTGHVRKVYGSVGVVFKGSGFYRTDSRAGNGTASNGKSESKAESTSSPAKSDSSDSKPAAKADSSSGSSSASSSSSTTASKAAAN